MSYFEWNIIHISKFKPGTVEKNSSTIGPPAGIKPTPLRCRCSALATEQLTRAGVYNVYLKMVVPANGLKVNHNDFVALHSIWRIC